MRINCYFFRVVFFNMGWSELGFIYLGINLLIYLYSYVFFFLFVYLIVFLGVSYFYNYKIKRSLRFS